MRENILSYNLENMVWSITPCCYNKTTQKYIFCTFDGDTFNAYFIKSKAHSLYEIKLLTLILRYYSFIYIYTYGI